MSILSQREQDAKSRAVGVTQILEVAITEALNSGDKTLATVTGQACLIKSMVIHSVTAAHADMTTCAVTGGAAKVIEFIAVADATEANLDAIDKQVAWTGAVRLPATKTIIMSLVGVGANAADMIVTIEYEACVAGGYLV